MAAVSLGPEPMMRKLGLIYRKDKALSKAALGFIQVILENAGGVIPVASATSAGGPRIVLPKAVSS
jgi:hypothetical protein